MAAENALVQRPLRFAVLIVAVLASTTLFLRGRPDDTPAPSLAEQWSGYYARDAMVMGTGADGALLYRVMARRAEQDPTDGGILFSGVQIAWQPATGVPWLLRANDGHVPADRHIIQLSGDVVAMTRPGTTPPARIFTRYLELDPEGFLASTDQGVVVERDRSRIVAQRMRAHLKQDRIEFETDVHGRFNP